VFRAGRGSHHVHFWPLTIIVIRNMWFRLRARSESSKYSYPFWPFKKKKKPIPTPSTVGLRTATCTRCVKKTVGKIVGGGSLCRAVAGTDQRGITRSPETCVRRNTADSAETYSRQKLWRPEVKNRNRRRSWTAMMTTPPAKTVCVIIERFHVADRITAQCESVDSYLLITVVITVPCGHRDVHLQYCPFIYIQYDYLRNREIM